MEVTAALAQFIVGMRSESIPETVRHEAKRALLNVLGCAIGSGRHATVERALSALRPFFSPTKPHLLDVPSAAISCMRRCWLPGISLVLNAQSKRHEVSLTCLPVHPI